MANLWVKIPAGTRGSRCKGSTCGLTIYFADHPNTGRAHPYDCTVEGGKIPTETEDGLGVTHYSTCPDANQFRRGTKR